MKYRIVQDDICRFRVERERSFLGRKFWCSTGHRSVRTIEEAKYLVEYLKNQKNYPKVIEVIEK